MHLAFHRNSFQHYKASPAIWDQTVLPDTGECVRPQLQAGRIVLNFPSLERRPGWVNV